MEVISKLLSSREIINIFRMNSLSSRQGICLRDTFFSLFTYQLRQNVGRDPVPGHGRAPGLPLLRRARDEGDVRSLLGQGGEYVVDFKYADQGDSPNVSKHKPVRTMTIFNLAEYFLAFTLTNVFFSVLSENQEGWVWDHYHRSVPMSTYLVAFVVSDFANLKSRANENTFFRGKCLEKILRFLSLFIQCVLW